MSIRTAQFTALALLLAATAAMADGASWDRAGNVELQSRLFARDALWPGQGSQAAQLSLAATAELRWRNAEGDQRASIIPFLRRDSVDEERNLVDLQEAYWAWESDSIELLAGVNTVFWGVTESAHLVDIVNQTDAAGDIDGEDKLGQPMVNLTWQQDWGLLSAYVMPYFRERNYPGVDGRLRAPLPVDSDRAVYESSRDENHVDVALRYSHYIGDIDVGLSVFSGTSREPRLIPADDAPVLLPHYDQIDQFGVDLQYTRDAWLWKLEAIARNGYSETFAAAVGGFEYTFYQVAQSGADIGVLLEYQYDGRNELEPFTTADNDVFAGLRLALNDTQDTSLLAGIAYDTVTGETFFNVEAERRIGNSISLEVRMRAFSGAGPQDMTYAVVRDDYVQIRLAKYF
ncbi:MAG: hypothetical protein OEQ30_01835 [Gammaproteobacteria bacterium]|jgi:hypothetical protein|nr:hypothetical protein [Gammaproteobacteria bacterium]MDH3846979.1 hypothetical protein [Gammaproteobacteria bacterium]MDH3905652.1 hypothetical protein [Gammaproteobacteria bacterium]MDH3908136.1 hypothetical protein [Gammaproteobacteria bacterium]